MFHLSLPVAAFADCLAFYRDCFDARIVMLGDHAANLFVFGGQLTLHDRPDHAIGPAQRREMHFGAVVSEAAWLAIRAAVVRSGRPVLHCVAPGAGGARGKLLVVDPGGNIVEVNGAPAPAGAR